MIHPSITRAAARAARALKLSLNAATVEMLEPRQLLSATAVLGSNHLLTVTGTDSSETINVLISGNTITATDNGQKLGSWPASSVNGVNVAGNGGNDAITVKAGAIPATLHGGAGNDILTGGGGANVLRGDEGNDLLIPGGGPSNDIFGDSGNDTVSYANRTHGVEIHLDNFRDSGMAGEHDRIGVDVENAYGSQSNDIIFGNTAGAKGALDGQAGNDTIYAGSAPTALYGGDGNDLLNSRNNVADYLDGGNGTDTAHADTGDTLVSIENVLPADPIHGGTIDTSFGVNGYLTGFEATRLLGGSVIAQAVGTPAVTGPNGLVLFAPNGQSPLPFTAALPTVPSYNVQSDGKYLLVSNGAVTRYNANRTVDRTFGVNGSVSNFSDGNPDHTFTPVGVTVKGMNIYVALDYKNQDASSPQDIFQAALIHLTPSGAIDRSFGNDNGFAIIQNNGALDVFRVGPDNTIYIAWDNNDAPEISRYTPTGQPAPGGFIYLDSPYQSGIADFEFTPDNKILMLATPSLSSLVLYRLNLDLSQDRSFGNNGAVDVPPPASSDSSVAGAFGQILQRADGEIIIGTSAYEDAPVFTLAFRPDIAAGSGAVAGRVFNDVNADRKQQPNEPGMAFTQVYADLNNNGVYNSGEPSGFADVLGNYSIQGLKPGTYTIRQALPAGMSAAAPAKYTVTVVANRTNTGLVFADTAANPSNTATLSGSVFNDANGDQLQDNGEKGLAGWQVYADMNNNGLHDPGEPIATTDSTGAYRITGLPAGGYVVREIVKSGFIQTTQRNQPLPGFQEYVAPGQNQTGNIFGNAAGNSINGSVSVTVYYDPNNNGRHDPGEATASGVNIILSDSNFKTVAQGFTNAGGSTVFPNIPPGIYTIIASDPNNGYNHGMQISVNPSQSTPVVFYDFESP